MLPVDRTTCAADGERALALLAAVRAAAAAIDAQYRAHANPGVTAPRNTGAHHDVHVAVAAYCAGVEATTMAALDAELVRYDKELCEAQATVASDDPTWQVRAAAARVDAIARELEDSWAQHILEDPQRAAAALHAALSPELTASDIAALAGVSATTLRAWRRGERTPRDPERLAAIAQAATAARGSFTPRGVVDWFARANPWLDDTRPMDLVNRPEDRPALAAHLLWLRGQVNT